MFENLQKVMKSVERIENRVVGQTSGPDTPRSGPRPPQDGVIKFSISSKGLTKQMSVADVTVAFFIDNYPAGFILDKESDSWNDLNVQEKRRIRNLFGTIKRAVRIVLLHSDSYPLTPDKETIRRVAYDAENRIRRDLEFGKKSVSIYTLTQHDNIKELEKTLKLPDNTPEDARKFFKSD